MSSTHRNSLPTPPATMTTAAPAETSELASSVPPVTEQETQLGEPVPAESSPAPAGPGGDRLPSGAYAALTPANTSLSSEEGEALSELGEQSGEESLEPPHEGGALTLSPLKEPPLLKATLEEEESDERRGELEQNRDSEFRQVHDRSFRKLQSFLNTLEQARGTRALIIIKGHPDPDSIASALAQQHFCRAYEIKTSIIYFAKVSHPENRALIKALDFSIQQCNPEGDFPFDSFDYLCFVDTPDTELPPEVTSRYSELPPTLTLIDHHKELTGLNAAFVDVREACGSTSSIYSEYLEFSPPALALNRSDSSHALIATALMHGIRTDTDNLLLASAVDFYAAAYLRTFIDRDLLRVISQQSVSARTMEIIQRGLNNKVIKGTFLLAGVEFVRDEDRDGIAQTADFLIRHEGVETAVVFGIVNNSVVDGSLRTSSATIDPDRWIKEAFGSNQQGDYYGGGRRNKGAFQIPLGLLAKSPDKRALWKLGERTVRTMIFQKIGETEDSIEEEDVE